MYSTRQVAAIGDRAWRRVLDDHDTATRARTERFGGTVVKQLGDGFLLRFPGPTAAIHAAQDLQAELVKLGLHLRIAVHTGEAEVRGDDLSGVAVHLCSRMLTVAPPDGIVVTGVVKGLVAGSALRFDDLGRHRLKGIPDEWDLYLVQESAS